MESEVQDAHDLEQQQDTKEEFRGGSSTDGPKKPNTFFYIYKLFKLYY